MTMPFAVELTFPAGRYHATPWGAHVNEGLIEWPPSPWRVLRALVACWHRKAQGEVRREVMAEIADCLADSLPQYDLPAGWRSHTRHYMPDYASTNKIYDGFLHVQRGGALRIGWPDVALSPEALRGLEILFDRLGYLGRAESWVVAKVLPTVPTMNVRPVGCASLGSRDARDTVRLLAPVPPGELDHQVTQVPKRKSTKKGKAPAPPPVGVLDVLEVDTADVQKGHWDRPPGTRWVEYELPEEVWMEPAPPRRTRKLQTNGEWSVARYAVTGKVVPRLTEALRLGERVHQRLVTLTKDLPQQQLFTGQDSEGNPLMGNQHVYVYCESAGKAQGRITHVNVCSRTGFDDESEEALRRLTRVWGVGENPLQLILLGVGVASDFGGSRVKAGQSLTLATATSWASSTPFVATRHPKARRDGTPKLDEQGVQIGSPEHDLRRLLREFGLPEPLTVAPLEYTRVGGRPTRWLTFRTTRRSGAGGKRGPSWGCGFAVTFAEPVSGPITVGYGAHFGLGLFEPAIAHESDK